MTPDLSFGAGNHQWHYTKATKTYDLSRGAPSVRLATTHGAEDTFMCIAPSLSALVIVDMQNFFLHPSLGDHPTGLAAVAPLLSVIEKCRELGIQIIWLNWGLSDIDLASMPPSIQRSFSRSLIDHPQVPRCGFGTDLGDDRGRVLMKGEWNTELYGPLAAAVREDDLHFDKRRVSGIWGNQDLQHYLSGGPERQSTETRTVFFAGVNTDQCVLGTLMDAYNGGWDCVLVDDCCGTTTPGAREVCLHNAACYGFVVDSTSFLAGKLD